MTFIELLRDHLDAFNQAYDGHITSSMRHAIFGMLNCRSNTERTSQWACQGCTHTADFPLSCGHRSCPQCQHNATTEWL
ncbi:transposase zinc-binding domain-containing protein, partial [Shewanella sp. 5_MG-2023]|uniref:transposase zinc-binding domain-containing protein n=1 Tax=Shewanella sp. 5_MG-2023 TaxID=3062656 RepID=UPI0026E2CF48